MTTPEQKTLSRVVSWVSVAVYTALLPHATVVYKAIAERFSAKVAGQVPLGIIILSGLAYVIGGFIAKKGARCLVVSFSCAIITAIILCLEPNPNKYIHIPEYVLMALLLFKTISLDYRGKGILLLVVLCASMLGVVDELQQGLYQKRHYGWVDMAINSSSSVMGALALLGLRHGGRGDWHWRTHLRRMKVSIGIQLIGAAGAAIMCAYLFQVEEVKRFWGVYPLWLLVWNYLYLGLGSTELVYRWSRLKRKHRDRQERDAGVVTAHLWVVCPLAILLLMHALAVLTSLTGWTFG